MVTKDIIVMALEWVAYRLGVQMPASMDARFSVHKTWTAGELHERIYELYGEPGCEHIVRALATGGRHQYRV